MGGGVPDVHMCAEGYPFWVELKTTKTNRINISSGQIAWNHAYWRSGGVSFFLVHPLKGRNLYLFAGDKGRELATHGLAVRGSGSGNPGGNPRPIRYNPPGPSAQAHSQANKCPVRYEVTRTGLGDSQSPVMQRRVFSRGRARRSQQPRAAAGVGIIGILCSWCPCTARGTRRPLRRLVSRFSCPRSHGAV